MVTIIFESHSTSIDNEAKKASGWNDIDLSELGMKQADELALRYADRNIDAIFTADLQRAYKTAVPTAKARFIPMYIDQRLRGCDYGELTQANKDVVDRQKANRIEVPFPGGESYQQCIDRMNDFLDMLKQDFDGKTVLVIGSRATQYGIEHRINNTSIHTCVTDPWSWQPGWTYQLIQLVHSSAMKSRQHLKKVD